MSAEQRKPYDMRAKQAKQGKKYTSQGIEIAEIERQERQQRDREEAMRQDIKNMVQQLQHCNSKDKIIRKKAISDALLCFQNWDNISST